MRRSKCGTGRKGIELRILGSKKGGILPIILIASNVFCSVPAQSSNSTENWRNSGLRFSKAENLLTPETCLKDLKHFALCMESVQIILNSTGSGLELKARDTWLNADQDKVEDWGLIKVARRKTPNAEASAAERLHEKQLRISLWTKLYKDFQRASLPWKSEFWESRFTGLTPKRTLEDLFLWVQLDFINPENEAALAARVINLFLSHSTDPYSYLYPRQQFRSEVRNDDDEYVGLGVVFRRWGDLLIVDQVDAGTPAGRAGIAVGDILKGVNGVKVSASNIQSSLEKLKGPKGTAVELELFHLRGEQTYRLTRETIRIPNVQYEMREHGDVRTAVIRVGSFLKAHTCEKIKSYVRLAKAESADGILLDMRGNPGGLVSQGVCTAGLFLPENLKVVVSRSVGSRPSVPTGDRSIATHEPKIARESMESFFSSRSTDTTTPLILLVDEDSASSSEIVAGALQDHGRALVMGKRTYGKGTFQRGHPFDSEGNILLFKTVAKFELPSGRMNQLVGLEPDIVTGESTKSKFSLQISLGRAYADAKKNLFLWSNDSKAIDSLKNCGETHFFQDRLDWIRADHDEALAEAHIICHSRHFRSDQQDLRVARARFSP